jgi:retron-type reverse transcriptase
MLSKPMLISTWKASRDSKSNPGRPGIDDVTARQFSAKLDSNISDIVRRLSARQFGFSKLRAVFLPKPDTEKERVICIPTVRDRLVQRAIAGHLAANRRFKIENRSSFGYVRGLGPQHAIKRVLQLRSKYEWCLKTDIQSFFDKIPRQPLKEKVAQALRGNSLEPLILRAIDCEVKTTAENREKITKQGLVPGLGIRQGMPLSPLLANFALADFDRHVEGRRINMVRYADDLVLFFRTKDEAREGHKYIGLLLKTFQLSIPEIADGSKSKIVSRSDALDFLGREIVPLGSGGSFVAKVGRRQIDKITMRLRRDYSFAKRSSEGKNFQETVFDLSKSMAAYLGIYRDAFNYLDFSDEMRGLGRSLIVSIFQDLFGREILSSLNPRVEGFWVCQFWMT